MLRILDKLATYAHDTCRGIVPKTMISFFMVGTLGLVVHMTVLNVALLFVTSTFIYANGTAMLSGATFNYLLNNKSTFRKQTLSGRKIFAGYAIYMLIISVGLASSLTISSWMFDRGHHPMAAALCGIVVGAFWDYLMTSLLVWRLLSKVRSSDE